MLSVYTDYFTLEDLASYYVGTPDPFLNNPPFGQRMMIEWSIPEKLLPLNTMELVLTIRYRNRSEEEKIFPLKKASGTLILSLEGEAYCETGGFLTYKLQLKRGNCVIEEQKHQLWKKLIRFEISPDKEPCEEEEEKLEFLPLT